jgi:hypothetical protein
MRTPDGRRTIIVGRMNASGDRIFVDWQRATVLSALFGDGFIDFHNS